MLELEDAQQRILNAIHPLPIERVALADAHGCFAAENVVSEVHLPPFDNAAMDGYAVQAKDVANATGENPVTLKLIGRVAAGERFSGTVTPGTCVRLFTGSPLPEGADSVVMQEDTELDSTTPGQVRFKDLVKMWENVRFRGEDVKPGQILIQTGDKINAGGLALLAASGLCNLSVRRRPVIGLIATGSELVEPGHPLDAGQIHESNRAGLACLTRAAGAIPHIFPMVRDTLEDTSTALKRAFADCDAVVTSGGVSVGEMDFVKSAFEAIGGQLDFWKVAIKPGKPFVWGRWKNKYLFGVPGNPVSALVTFTLLVQPALLRLHGASECLPETVPSMLAEPFSNPGDRRHFVRVRLDATGNARSSGVQSSHILSSLAQANALLDLPPKSHFAAGQAVSIIRWE